MNGIVAITIPRWGLTMEEGTLNCWLAEDGQRVERGAVIAEIESSKIAGELEASSSGMLRKLVEECQTLPIGSLIGIIAEEEVDDAAINAFIQSFVPVEAATVADEAAGPRTVDVPGAILSYLRKGEGESIVLLIHGFGGDANGWAFVQDALARDHDVIALDLPGHGLSSKAVMGGSLEGLARTVADFADALNLRRVHIVAHSMGGGVAMVLALARPEIVASLTLIAPVGLGPEINNDYLTGFIGAEKRRDVEKVLRSLFFDESLVTRPLAEEVVRYKRLDGVADTLKTIYGAMVSEGRQKVTFREKLPAIAAPITIVWGDEDRILPAIHASGLNGSVVVVLISSAGHMPQVEATDQVIGAARHTFVRSQKMNRSSEAPMSEIPI